MIASHQPGDVSLARQQPAMVVTPWLVRLRWFSLAALVAAGSAAQWFWHVQLPVAPLLGLLLAMAATNAALAWQLRSPRPQRERIGAVLILDVMLLTGTLYLVGGPLNPLSIIYLVSITIAAVALGYTWALGIAAVSNAAYALTFLYNRPLAFHDPTLTEHMLPLHLSGMWVAFITASGLVAHFVGRVSEALAQRECELVELRAAAARSDRLAALLSLGAGAAHELATPLSTIGTAAGELWRIVGNDDAGRAGQAATYVDIIRSEVDRCARVLDHLSGRAGEVSMTPAAVETATLIDELRSRLGESLSARLDVALPETVRPVRAPAEALRQTLVALLQNAFDASAPDQRVALRLTLHSGLRVEVSDHGRGMTAAESARAGEPFFTTKQRGGGLGLGLFLAQAFAEQMGGTVTWRSQAGAGTDVILDLPSA